MLFLFFATALCLVTLVVPRAVLALPPQERWNRVRTTNFVLVGNYSPSGLREIAIRLERFRTVLQAGRQTESELASQPTTIVVFKDEFAFAPYKIQKNGQPSPFQGFFQAGLDCNYIGMDGDPNRDPFEIVYHEYVHYFMSRRYGVVPLWLNEGLAEYYSTVVSAGDRIEVGRRVVRHVQYLTAHELMPLAELFALNTSSKEYSEGRRAGVIYAQSWALVHYLLLGNPEMKPRLQKYLDLTSGTQTPVKAFPEAFEMTTSQLETVLGVYVRGNNFNYEQLSMPNLPAEEVHEAEALGRAEVLYVLGDYLRHTTPWRQADAEEHFREALRIDSNHARAHAALACLLEENDNWTEVQEHFDRAVEVGRDDDLTFFLYGHSLLERSMVQGFPLLPMRLPAQIKKARGYIGRCLELNPNRAEAYVDLGKTYLFDPMDTQAGIAALERGRSLLPARMDIPYYGMMLCVRVGDGECAKGLANHVLVHSEDPQLRETAQQVLGNDASNQTGERIENAIEKLNAGDLKGGIALLKQLREKATDANRQDEIDRLLKEAQESQREAERIDKLNRQIARYNKAVAKARSGDTAGAAAILEELSKTVQDSKLSNQIRDAQKQLGVQPKK